MGIRVGLADLEGVVHTKKIVCLANSRKINGRSIAGREWNAETGAGNWVRPVSARENREVSEYERQYEDGSDPQVLDVIEIPLLEPCPDGYQSENWLLHDGCYWRKAGMLSRFELGRLVDPVARLWIDGYSTHSGVNDKIPLQVAERLTDSLRLIRVDRVKLSVFAPGEAFGNAKRRVQGRFEHAGSRYALWITDPGYERNYLAKLDGTYELGDCFLTISLGEPFQGDCHKLVAAVIDCGTSR